MRREFLPAIVVPGLGIQRIIVTSSHGIIPVPGIERSLLRMRSCQDLRDTFSTFGLLIHRKLVRPDGLVFMHATLDVPAREIPAISAGEGPRPEAAHWSALPVAVINHSRGSQCRLASARVFQSLANAALPCRFRDGVASEEPRRARDNQAKHDADAQRMRGRFHAIPSVAKKNVILHGCSRNTSSKSKAQDITTEATRYTEEHTEEDSSSFLLCVFLCVPLCPLVLSASSFLPRPMISLLYNLTISSCSEESCFCF